MSQVGFLSIDRITHRAALVGRTLDALAKGPLAGVTVQLVDAPDIYKARLASLREGRPGAQPERLTTDAQGNFCFLDLPAGRYTLQASLSGPRYASALATVDVAAGSSVATELLLAPTSIRGTVYADKPAGALALARVRLLDSGEVTFTASDGSFTLSPLEPGSTRVLSISAEGYGAASRTLSLQQGQNSVLPTITLVHS